MASRALIIAVEEYPMVTGGMVEKKLPGVLSSGLDFQRWLRQKWALEHGADFQKRTQMIFCSEPAAPAEVVAEWSGASWGDASWDRIVESLEQLKLDGQGATSELFVFFSGHGFRFEDAPGSRTDILAAGDFAGRGNRCLKLDEMVRWLVAHLGSGRHYFFIDSCRNVLDRTALQVGDALPWNPNVSGEATCYVLQSTVSGAPALVAGPFAESLMGGLRGRSRAKIWAEDPAQGMMVRYDSLRTWLKKNLADKQPITSRVDGEEGESEAIFTVLNPPALSTLTVHLNGLPPGAAATLKLTRVRDGVERAQPAGELSSLSCVPDNYWLDISLEGALVQPAGRQTVDLYEEAQSLDFQLSPAGLESMPEPVGAAPEEGAVKVEVPDGAEMEVKGVDVGTRRSAVGSASLMLPQGRYEAVLRSRGGMVLRRQSLEVAAGHEAAVNLGAWAGSLPHREIAHHFPGTNISPMLSETLGGGMDDPDLNLWLTLLGGGRILGSDGRFSKLRVLPLHDFSGMTTETSALYVLAGFERAERQLRVSLTRAPGRESDGAGAGSWQRASAPPSLASIRELSLPLPIGQSLVTLSIDVSRGEGGWLAPITVVVAALPGRVTLLSVTLDEEGEPEISQFILPLGHLQSAETASVRNSLAGRNPLPDLKWLAQAARLFRQRRNLRNELRGPEMDDLLEGRWLDPVGGALMGYECARRGDMAEAAKLSRILREHFPELPDGAALARLAGGDAEPQGIPIFTDGWLALRGQDGAPEPPAGSLDYGSSLTTWQGGISD